MHFLSQQPSPKIFLQFLYREVYKISMNLVKIIDKNFAKKIFGIGCCDKIASEYDFSRGIQGYLLRIIRPPILQIFLFMTNFWAITDFLNQALPLLFAAPPCRWTDLALALFVSV